MTTHAPAGGDVASTRGGTAFLAARWFLVPVALLLLGLTGCWSDSDFGPDLSVAAADDLKTETAAIYERALEPAMEAVGGSRARGGHTVRALRCSDFADRRHVELRVRGSFVVEGRSPRETVRELRRAWLDQGWKVRPFNGFELIFRAASRGSIRRNGGAAVYDLGKGSTEPSTGIRLEVGTGCFAIPDSLVESGWPRGSGR